MRNTLAVLLALATTAGSTSAAEVDRNNFNHAVAACQPALPAFDGLIRKRPKAVANEGTSVAFVSCATGSQPNAVAKVAYVDVSLLNRAAAAVTVNCTLVDGFGDGAFNPSKTKSRTINPGVVGNLAWNHVTDNASVRYSAPALSCGLPPGVEVAGMSVTALEEIGD